MALAALKKSVKVMKAKKHSVKKRPVKIQKKAKNKAKPPSNVKILKKAKTEKPDILTLLSRNPVEVFFQHWKPKSETIPQCLEKILKTEWGKPEVRPLIETAIHKIQTHMRKEPLNAEIESELAERFPRDRILRLSSIWAMKPKTTIRLNVLKADLNGFSSSLSAKDLGTKRSVLSPWAFDVADRENTLKHLTYERGLYEIQDEASQMIALISNARPGQRLLDLYAHEGEKALTLSMMMKNKGSLFVYDQDLQKLKNFKERAQKLELDNFRILNEAQVAEVKGLDCVVLEAPSSCLGCLGTHPEVKWRFHKEELPRLQKIQAALLRDSARKLKLGGYLLYATRSLNQSENEKQIEHFLKSTHNSYRLVPMGTYLKESVMPYMQNFFGFQWDDKLFTLLTKFDPYFVLSPDIHGTDGLFVAIIQRIRIST